MQYDERTITGLCLRLASPRMIRSWSSGEVSGPSTINYLTQKPEPGGLFCERIFGPTKDWTCFCGKYQRARTPGFVCDVCGVEITESTVRRERMGHIELATPVAHPWFAKRTQSSILSTLLALSPRRLSAILSYQAALVTHIDESAREEILKNELACAGDEERMELLASLASLTVGTVLEAEEERALTHSYGHVIRVQWGAQGLRSLLSALDLDALAASLKQQLVDMSHPPRKLLKRLQIVEAFRSSGVSPASMILSVLPVLPPELRPLVPLSGGRYAASDVNALYERILHRNARIRRFQALGAPAVMLRYEQRLLQDACDALFDNRHTARPRTGSHGQTLKSLADILEGKQGRFRRNLLGKRVDYSGRSVIVGNPNLQLHQCGLPTKVCLELFKPFLIRKLLERHLASSARAAKRLVERTHGRDPVIWDLLEEVMTEQVVLLNRAPTLHRLSIQAFEAVRVEGLAIRLHPLVCSAFNADFDGDQMAVHLPLSEAAQAEARALLLSTRNLRSPATGEPTITLSQEIALGLFYLTQLRPSPYEALRTFADADEVRLALSHGVIDLHTRLFVRIDDPIVVETPGCMSPLPAHRRIETTAGRLLFNEALPSALRYRNYAMTKEQLKRLLSECLEAFGEETTARLADALKRLGFTYATRSGISFAISDIAVPPEKHHRLSQAESEAAAVEEQETLGMMTEEEARAKLIEIWQAATEEISRRLEAHLDPWGSLATIITSGATKAKFQQIRQLSGIRGLMAKPSGEIIPIPIKGNYLEGLTVWEVFIAASGARKGFMDRSLNTARSGYLTRRLVEAGMEVWITAADCGTTEGLSISQAECKAEGVEMKSRLLGRVLARAAPEASLPVGTLITDACAVQLVASGGDAVWVRSPLTCEASYGLCQQCYGADLSSGQLVQLGTAVGIIAGQSVGEPGTQLTMRTFHSGGIAGAQGDITAGLPRVEELFEARIPRQTAPVAQIGGMVQIERDAAGGILIHIREENRAWSEQRTSALAVGQKPLVTEGEQVCAGTPLCAGPINPHELLTVAGCLAVGRYLVGEVQRVYRQTGVYLHDKHCECLVRQMVRYVQIRHGGDTHLLPGQIVDRFAMIATNACVLSEGGTPAIARPVLLGITQAVLHTASWVAAASFQQTSRVLTEAAIAGQCDLLVGWKERVILGSRIPTGAQ